jgi:hypothetical protein
MLKEKQIEMLIWKFRGLYAEIKEEGEKKINKKMIIGAKLDICWPYALPRHGGGTKTS